MDKPAPDSTPLLRLSTFTPSRCVMAKPVRWFYYPACLQGRARRRLRLLQSGSDSDSDR